MRLAHHRTILRPEHLAFHADGERTQHAQRDDGVTALEVDPLSVKLVLVRIVRVDRHDEHVDEVRRVDGVGPAKLRPEAVIDEGRRRKQPAGNVEPFI
jgi:hypothetical protein